MIAFRSTNFRPVRFRKLPVSAFFITFVLLSILEPIKGANFDINSSSKRKNTSGFYEATSSAFQQPVPPANNNNNNIPPATPATVMRAWTCHGRNQRELVDRLMMANIIKNPAVQQVMYQVDRKNYAGFAEADVNYQDAPQPIGKGQTISAPHMHAHALEEILPYVQKSKNLNEPVRMLDVGCGSGYLTACLGRWVQPKEEGEKSILDGRTGQVFGIDIHQHLVDLATVNMKKEDYDLLKTKTVQLSLSNGWDGLPEHAPFDAIHVGAAAASFPHQLAKQLKVGGVLIVPIGPNGGAQALYKVERIADSGGADAPFEPKDFHLTELLGVRYVPLIDGPSS